MERRLPDSKSERDHANRPEIDLLIVSLSLLQDLRGQVVGRAAHCRPALHLHLPLRHQQRRQPKVADLDIHASIQEEVACFEIAMYNMSVVEVLDGAADLDDEAADFGEGQMFALLEHVGEGAVGA